MSVLNRHAGERLERFAGGSDYLFSLQVSGGFTGNAVLFVDTNDKSLKYETSSRYHEPLDEDSEPLNPDFVCDSVDTVFYSIITFHKDFLENWAITVDPKSLPVVEVWELPPEI